MVTYTMPAASLGWLVVGLLLFGATGGSVIAESTDITVRVIARNAMFAGDLVDGAQVTVTLAEAGAGLAAEAEVVPMCGCPVELPALHDITVYSYDPASGNTGVDHLRLTVTEE